MAQLPKGGGKLFRKKKSGVPVGNWFFKYGGRPVNSGTKDKAEAERQRSIYVGRAAEGRLMFPRVAKVGELLDLVKADYAKEGRKSAKSLGSRIDLYLRPKLGKLDAVEVDEDRVNSYKESRIKAGAKPATIDRELETLRRAYYLGKRQNPPLVERIPYIALYRAENVRTQRINHRQYRELMAALPSPERAAAIIAYHTGWRKSVILNLRWPQVDWEKRIVRRPVGQAKNKRVGTAPIYGDMQDALRACMEVQSEWVIHRADGSKVQDIRYAWRKARQAVGLSWFRFHDLRACAASNLIDAGVSQHEAKQILGHKTDSMFQRYDIVSPDRLKRIGARVDKFLEEAEEAESAIGAHLGRTQ